VPSTGDEQRRHVAAELLVPVDADPPARRRRSAVLGGGALVAASPFAVAAGLFVPGFAALGLGALLLLLPPRARRQRTHASPLRVVGAWAAAAGRRLVALVIGAAHVGARTFRAAGRFVAGPGRNGAARVWRATATGVATVGVAAAAAGARGWAAVQVVAPRVCRSLIVGTRSFARAARSTSIRAWARVEPMLRRAWAACVAGSARAGRELAALERSASKRLSAYIDSRSGPR